MNERIIELMNQANKDAGFTFSMDQAKPVHDLMEKFAKLIVQECINISNEQKKWAEEMEEFNDHDIAWNQARIQQSQHIVDKIKEHFGVE